MGSSGLVRQISTFAAMGTGTEVWLLILFFHFLLPAFWHGALLSCCVAEDGYTTAICVFPADVPVRGLLAFGSMGNTGGKICGGGRYELTTEKTQRIA